MVSVEVMNYLMEIGVVSFVFPVLLLMIWRLRTRKNMLPALAGAIMFLGFSTFLAIIPNTVFLGMFQPSAHFFNSNPICYALYNGVVAAILEETARYLAFRYILPKYGEQRETAVTYGIGHGGIECMTGYGITNLMYYVGATVLNNAGDTTDFPEDIFGELTGLTLKECVLDGITAVLFFILQIGLSVFMFQAYRNVLLCKRLFFFSMLFHMLAYLPGGFADAGLIPQLLAVILLAVLTALLMYVAVVIYKKMGENEKQREQEKKKQETAAPDSGWNIAKKKLNTIEEQKEDTSDTK